LINAKQQWNFSKWMLLKGVIGYSKSEFDTLFISKTFSFDVVGGFNMMKSLSTMPAREIIKPVTEPLLASFSKVKSEPEQLAYQIKSSICIVLLAVAPISTFLMMEHQLIVELLFDERWWGYSSILGIMAVLIVNFALVSVIQEALLAIGKIKFLFYYDLFTLILIISILLIINVEDVVEFTFLRTFMSVITMIGLMIFILPSFKIRLKSLLLLVFPAVVASISDATVLNALPKLSDIVFVELLLRGMISVTIYVFSSVAVFSLLSNLSNEIADTKKLILNMYNKFRPE